MLVSIFPHVTGIKVESSWGHGTKGIVRCVARLTRPLSAEQSERLGELMPLEASEKDCIVAYCPASEVEDWREALERSLVLAARASSRRTRKRRRLPAQ